MRLIIATKNNGKLREIKEILKGIDIAIVSLNQLDKKFRIIENGKSFLENALKKTMTVSKFFKDDYVVGDDSGLEVDCLQGAPGIFSKRYSGRNATYLKNNLKILRELQGIEKSKRRAHFCCFLTLVKDSRLIRVFEGNLKGIISEEIKGQEGFGYDPIFYLPKYKKTVAQLSLKEKNKISHRAKAFGKLKKYLISREVFYPSKNNEAKYCNIAKKQHMAV
ncbi:MAG: RdgB/HAM1 family non-canonical purine NTP pyrophosphatase [Candidatus Omnitrophica bacterium]|nr:RdgB/HAM1 family non-canonical purine NTP pyrophosphatase [Candidatus Omnitrophota bacterium]MBU2437122.1 RdgB/HAM1 family non-canonical purine NTP pyrophosphatase [Candidatus Omnitrophota bacterium]